MANIAEKFNMILEIIEITVFEFTNRRIYKIVEVFNFFTFPAFQHLFALC